MYLVLEKKNPNRSYVLNDYLDVLDVLGCAYEDIGKMASRIGNLGFNKFFDTENFVVACVTDTMAQSPKISEILKNCTSVSKPC